MPNDHKPIWTRIGQSFSQSVIFTLGTVAGWLVGYMAVGPVLLGAIQLSMDRFGDPISGSVVRVLHVAMTLAVGMVGGLSAIRLFVSQPNPTDAENN